MSYTQSTLLVFLIALIVGCSKDKINCGDITGSVTLRPIFSISLDSPTLELAIPTTVNVAIFLPPEYQPGCGLMSEEGIFTLHLCYRETEQDSFMVFPSATQMEPYPALKAGERYEASFVYSLSAIGDYQFKGSID